MTSIFKQLIGIIYAVFPRSELKFNSVNTYYLSISLQNFLTQVQVITYKKDNKYGQLEQLPPTFFQRITGTRLRNSDYTTHNCGFFSTTPFKAIFALTYSTPFYLNPLLGSFYSDPRVYIYRKTFHFKKNFYLGTHVTSRLFLPLFELKWFVYTYCLVLLSVGILSNNNLGADF